MGIIVYHVVVTFGSYERRNSEEENRQMTVIY